MTRRRQARQATIRSAAVSLGLLALMLSSRGAGAQQRPPSDIALSDVVRLSLESASDLRQARRQLMASEAGRSVAAAPFEPVVKAFGVSATDRAFQEISNAGGSSPVMSTSTGYGASIDRMLRNGVVLSPSVSVSRSALSSATRPPPNIATVNLGVTLPILRGWAGASLRAGELAAATDADASALDVRQTAARIVLGAASAYWDYLAAYRRLDVQVVAERRAKELLDETRQLVIADERSPSELHSLDANAALKRIPRIAAEQSVLEARQRLGIALGIPASAIWSIGSPGTDFPVATDLFAPTEASAASLAEQAAALRPDLAAARARVSSATLVQAGMASENKPRLDVVFAVGYTGGIAGSALQQYYSAIYRGVAGMNTTVQISYQPTIGAASARARVEQAEVAVDRSSIALGDLQRTAIAATRVAAEGLRSARAQLETAEEAVALSTKAVESELTKFRLGMSTRFDVIQAEDALTGALLSRIGAQLLAGQALARLRYESGRLIGDDDHGLHVDVKTLLRSNPSDW